MKKICINLLPFTNKLSGTGYYIKRLLKYLQKIDNINHYDLLISRKIKSPKDLFQIEQANFEFKQITLGRSKLNRIFFEQIILPFKYSKCYDVFFSPSTALPLFGFSKSYKITTIHDLIPFLLKEKYKGIQKYYIRLITRYSARKADKVLTVSKNSKKDIIQVLKINPDKIEIIYNFIEVPTPTKTSSLIRENSFVFIGNIQPGKNIERLLIAFDKFSTLNPDYTLKLIGKKGWNYNNIHNEYIKLKNKHKIEFLGYLPEKLLIKQLQKSRALIYPSLYEGFGIPPLEAIMYKCPVIVSNNSSLPEVVGKAGIYIDPYSVKSIFDGLNLCLNNDYLLSKTKYFEEEALKFNALTETKKLLNIINNASC